VNGGASTRPGRRMCATRGANGLGVRPGPARRSCALPVAGDHRFMPQEPLPVSGWPTFRWRQEPQVWAPERHLSPGVEKGPCWPGPGAQLHVPIDLDLPLLPLRNRPPWPRALAILRELIQAHVAFSRRLGALKQR